MSAAWVPAVPEKLGVVSLLGLVGCATVGAGASVSRVKLTSLKVAVSKLDSMLPAWSTALEWIV